MLNPKKAGEGKGGGGGGVGWIWPSCGFFKTVFPENLIEIPHLA